MPTDEQIAIIVGWALRGGAAMVFALLAFINSQRPVSRVAQLGTLLLAASLVAPVAEYTGVNFTFARTTETAVLSTLVVTLLAVVFKGDPVAWVGGVILLVISNVLYITASVTDSADWEAAALVIGGTAALVALLLTRWTHTERLFGFVVLLAATAMFYIAVILVVIFGPFVLAEWNLLTWTIVWEISTTLFYITLAVCSWFWYVPASAVSGIIPSDVFDWAAFIIQTGAWAPSMKEAMQ